MNIYKFKEEISYITLLLYTAAAENEGANTVEKKKNLLNNICTCESYNYKPKIVTKIWLYIKTKWRDLSISPATNSTGQH